MCSPSYRLHSRRCRLSFIGLIAALAGGGLPAAPAPDAADSSPGPLGHWRFNEPSWRSENGAAPLVATRLASWPSYDGAAVLIHTTNRQPRLQYPVIQSNGVANLSFPSGSIRFWYQPWWSSKDRSATPGYSWGQGPGHWIRLVEVRAPSRAVPFMALSIDPAGTNLVLQSLGPGGAVTNAQGRIALTYLQPDLFTNGPGWHEISASYSPARTELRLNGVLVAEGSGLAAGAAPDFEPVEFSMGSAGDGTLAADGLIDELETFSHPLGPVEVLAHFDVLSATADRSPPALHLHWRVRFSEPIRILRRGEEQEAWELLATNFSGLRYTDTNVVAGRRYAYRVGTKFLWGAVDGRPVEKRGRVILLVDETIRASIEPELVQLQEDLAGDGWEVVRFNVPRHDDGTWAANIHPIAEIKSRVLSAYHPERNRLHCVFIIGHVAIPYSGYEGLDGHPEHQGAWPADGYYGDADGVWTDHRGDFDGMQSWGRATKTAPGVLPDQSNDLGDGKFDNDFFPTNRLGQRGLELAVGRIDFARLPVFHRARRPQSEVDLLRQYLGKLHRYRHKQIQFTRRAMVTGQFYEDPFHRENAPMYSNALRNGTRWLGVDPGAVQEGDLFRQTQLVLWGFQAGWAGPDRLHDSPRRMVRSADFVDPAAMGAAAFYTIDGSFLGDWNMTNNLLRVLLAPPDSGLASMWARHTDWRLETMALGEPLGPGLLRTVNESQLIIPRHIALLGDPTLRLQITAPPADLAGASGTGRAVRLSWKAAPEVGARYFVYRSSGPGGSFANLTPRAIAQTQFADPDPPPGRRTYQVRTAARVVTGSGAYTNLSQGIFVTVE